VWPARVCLFKTLLSETRRKQYGFRNPGRAYRSLETGWNGSHLKFTANVFLHSAVNVCDMNLGLFFQCVSKLAPVFSETFAVACNVCHGQICAQCPSALSYREDKRTHTSEHTTPGSVEFDKVYAAIIHLQFAQFDLVNTRQLKRTRGIRPAAPNLTFSSKALPLRSSTFGLWNSLAATNPVKNVTTRARKGNGRGIILTASVKCSDETEVSYSSNQTNHASESFRKLKYRMVAAHKAFRICHMATSPLRKLPWTVQAHGTLQSRSRGFGAQLSSAEQRNWYVGELSSNTDVQEPHEYKLCTKHRVLLLKIPSVGF
jgi:hypothetical protein